MILLHFGSTPTPDWLFGLAIIIGVVCLLWKILNKPLFLLLGLLILAIQAIWYASCGKWGEFRKKLRR
ncbi:hypothetical protein IMSAGC008_00171 [Muribaculaceae bacterium]|nr:hypothetical protein IMSAGC008_00171 [Muribaculaceae bacterium]